MGKKDIQYVYALSHPLTGQVGYVGVTNDPRSRFLQHLKSAAKQGPNAHPKDVWICELAKVFLIPVMEILSTTTWHGREVVESEMILEVYKTRDCTDGFRYWVGTIYRYGVGEKAKQIPLKTKQLKK